MLLNGAKQSSSQFTAFTTLVDLTNKAILIYDIETALVRICCDHLGDTNAANCWSNDRKKGKGQGLRKGKGKDFKKSCYGNADSEENWGSKDDDEETPGIIYILTQAHLHSRL